MPSCHHEITLLVFKVIRESFLSCGLKARRLRHLSLDDGYT
jgi:hypothetical protein